MVPSCGPSLHDFWRACALRRSGEVERARLERLRARAGAQPLMSSSLHQSRSAPRLVRPPSASLFVPEAFEHGATVKLREGEKYLVGGEKY